MNKEKPAMLDLLAIGDTQTDFFVELDPGTVGRSADSLFLPLAKKISVRSITRVAGVGSAPNLAVGCARLGLRTGVYTIVGNDEEGKAAVSMLQEEGVDRSLVKTVKQPTDLAIVLNLEGERTLLMHQRKKEYGLPEFLARFVFVGQMGEDFETVFEMLNIEAKKKVKIVVNPGPLQLRYLNPSLFVLLKDSFVIIVNKEEAGILTRSSSLDEKKLVVALHALGPKIAVVTDGPKGSWGSDGSQTWFVPIYPSKIIERTGAGDAYATGVIAGLFYQQSLASAMLWGAVNAASVVEKIGAREGLLTQTKLQEKIAGHPEVQPKQIA